MGNTAEYNTNQWEIDRIQWKYTQKNTKYSQPANNIEYSITNNILLRLLRVWKCGLLS